MSASFRKFSKGFERFCYLFFVWHFLFSFLFLFFCFFFFFKNFFINLFYSGTLRENSYFLGTLQENNPDFFGILRIWTWISAISKFVRTRTLTSEKWRFGAFFIFFIVFFVGFFLLIFLILFYLFLMFSTLCKKTTWLFRHFVRKTRLLRQFARTLTLLRNWFFLFFYFSLQVFRKKSETKVIAKMKK